MGYNSVGRVQNKFCPKDLFITERDQVFKEEPEEEEPEPGEKKKKKKKAKKEEVKMYPHHKYSFAKCGKPAKGELNSVFSFEDPDQASTSTAISLSYFIRPGTTSDTTSQFMSNKLKQNAKDLIAQKKLQLQSILQETETIKEGDGSIVDDNIGEPDQMDDLMSPSMEDEDDDDDDDSQDMEGDSPKKLKVEEDDHVFDVAYELQSQIKEYKTISDIFRRNKVPYAER